MGKDLIVAPFKDFSLPSCMLLESRNCCEHSSAQRLSSQAHVLLTARHIANTEGSHAEIRTLSLSR